MNPQQSHGNSGVLKLAVFLPEQALEKLPHQLEGKAGQGDQDGGVVDREGLLLTPNWKDSVREFVEEQE